MKEKIKSIVKLDLSLLFYGLIIFIIIGIITFFGYKKDTTKLIKSVISSVQDNIDKDDLKSLNEYVSTIFTSMDLSVSTDEINTTYTARFGHLKAYDEYKSVQTALDLIGQSDERIEDLGILYVDIDNDRMVYLADSGNYDLGVIRGLSYSLYSKMVLKKKVSFGKINNTKCLFKGGNIVNSKNAVIGTVVVYVSFTPFFKMLLHIGIAYLIITIITCVCFSFLLLRLPGLYKRAAIYLKANEVVIEARKEKKSERRELKRKGKLNKEKKIEDELKDEFDGIDEYVKVDFKQTGMDEFILSEDKHENIDNYIIDSDSEDIDDYISKDSELVDESSDYMNAVDEIYSATDGDELFDINQDEIDLQDMENAKDDMAVGDIASGINDYDFDLDAKDIESTENIEYNKDIEITEDIKNTENIDSAKDSDKMKPKSKPREKQEGDEDHPVIDWIVDQL